jgi:hypothetical protein
VLTESFYWDKDEGTRAWSERFAKAHNGNMPSMVQAGVYGAVTHYLKAVEAAKSKEPAVVMAKMKEMPTEDPLFGKGTIRPDGPQDARHVPLRGEEARRVEGQVGLLQARRDAAGRSGLPSALRKRVPTHQEELT